MSQPVSELVVGPDGNCQSRLLRFAVVSVSVMAVLLGLWGSASRSHSQAPASRSTASAAEDAETIGDYPQMTVVGRLMRDDRVGGLRLCQATSVEGMFPTPGASAGEPFPCDSCVQRTIPWQAFAQGEYVGPYRDPHVGEYRLRVDDQLDLVFRLTREQSSRPYQLQVGDRVRVESMADNDLDRELLIQPDGTITVKLLGQVMAARRTVDELRIDLEARYKQYYQVPAITVTPQRVDTRLEDLRSAIDNRQGIVGGQSIRVRVTPEGTIQLPAIGSMMVQGLSLDEMKREVDERYLAIVEGIEVTPILFQRAPRFIYVVGEVRNPGRFELGAPTTLMQSIALAGGWSNGGNLKQVIVFRRTEDWRLVATRLDVRGALYGKRTCPADEIWVRDSDLIVIPKTPVRVANDAIELLFTRGLYGVLPFFGSSNGGFVNLSTL